MPIIKNQSLVEAHCARIYGCDERTALTINGDARLRQRGSAAMRYCHQRQAAKKRGIAWDLTFPQWARIWAESGRWAQRGPGIGGYCMARRGDSGPYNVGNVFIQLSVDNSRDGLATRHRRAADQFVEV